MERNRKRQYSALGKRLPLAETSANANVPLPVLKKAKLKLPANPFVNRVEEIADVKGDENVHETKELSKDENEQEGQHLRVENDLRKPKGDLRKAEQHPRKPDNEVNQIEQPQMAEIVVKEAESAPKEETERKKTEERVAKSARLVGDELKSWQASWRKIMRESVVYFDTQGCDSANQNQHQEQKRAQRALKLVGCEIVPFYDRDVSVIVSRRPFSAAKSYPTNDIFNDAVNLKIKVWDFDKVFRFLKNLGVSESATQERTGNLSNLLKEEKIFGSTDRDPNARRDDLYYLEKNFVYVYDLSQAVRPIAVREWSSDSYPAFHLTLDGKCPFIADTSDNLERKKLRRAQKFNATRDYRELLRKVTEDIMIHARDGVPISTNAFSGTSTSTDSLEGHSTEIDGEGNENDTILMEKSTSSETKAVMAAHSFKPPPAVLMRASLVVQPFNNSMNSKFYDVAASGYNGASNAVQFSMDSTLNSVAQQHAQQGNGLGPTVSQVPSKNINNLKRRIFMKKHMQKSDGRERERELKPGYCENCRVKYDHFEEHIYSNRHRNFACNDDNFRDIDELISTLNESKSMGYVTSNGDFSFVS